MWFISNLNVTVSSSNMFSSFDVEAAYFDGSSQFLRGVYSKQEIHFHDSELAERDEEKVSQEL